MGRFAKVRHRYGRATARPYRGEGNVRRVTVLLILLSFCHFLKWRKRRRKTSNLTIWRVTFSNATRYVCNHNTLRLIFNLQKLDEKTRHFLLQKHENRPILPTAVVNSTTEGWEKAIGSTSQPLTKERLTKLSLSKRIKSSRGRKVPPRAFEAILAGLPKIAM